MPWYRHLLWPFAILYGIGVYFRNRLFDLGFIESKKFGLPIICVGNLETGGTGKSPLVHYVTRILMETGLNVAVLSRGYGRNTKGFRLVETDAIADEVGDEALQSKLRFGQAIVAVCENRVEGVNKLLEFEKKPDVIIMDDGFQHRYIDPGLKIITSPAGFPFWKNHLLPVGTLREGRSCSERAEALVLTNAVTSNEQTNFHGKVFHSSVNVGELVQINGPSLPDAHKSFIIFSGIANSDRFEAMTRSMFKVVDHIRFSDHHGYSVKDIRRLKENYDSFGAAVNAVLTTEKDAARLLNSPLLNEFGSTPVFYLPIEISLLGSGKQEFEKMILAYGKHA